jgi:hypothetical protein
MLRSAIRASSVGDGGAPPVATRTGAGAGAAAGSLASIVSTVGAALKCVTPSSRMWRQIRPVSIAWRQRWVPPAAVTAHGKHHPLQWNIGRVQRKTEEASSREW